MATAAEHKAEIDRINAELNTQTDLISQIQTALEGKAAGSGGASVGTCTVEIHNVSNPIKYVSGMRMVGESPTPFMYEQAEMTSDPFIIENVVCNSILAFWGIGGITLPAISGSAQVMTTINSTKPYAAYGVSYDITSATDSTVSFSIYSD